MTMREHESRDAWLSARRRSIGSSDAPALWGHGYSSQSLFAMWAEKTHGTSQEWSKADLRMLALGKAAEPVIREWFSDETGLEVKVDPEHAIRTHPSISYLTASLDAWVMHPAYGFCPVECKRVGRHNLGQWFSNGAPDCPMGYQIQAGHQMIVTGARMAFVVGMVDEKQLEIREIPASEEFERGHLLLCDNFWKLVMSGEPPPADGSEATTDAINRLYPRPTTSEFVVLDDEWDARAEELAECARVIREARKHEDALKNRLRALIGTHEGGRTMAGTAWSCKLREVAGYTVEPSSRRELRKISNK